jgi:molybdopterin-guanine dinucleotide biosynthesis protein A
MKKAVNHRSALTGIVLAGGESARLGQDKATLILDASGRDLLCRAVRLLERFTPRVLVVGRRDARFASLPDDAPGVGPAGGVATALRRSGTPCLVLSCDLPFMNEATLTKLLAAREARRPETLCTLFVHQETGRPEPLTAVYELGALPCFDECLAQRRLTLARIVPQALQERVPYSNVEALPFFSINYPADLAAASLLLSGIGG